MSVNDRWRVTVDWDGPTADIAQSVWHYNQNVGALDYVDEFATELEAMLALMFAEIDDSIDDSVGMIGYSIAKYDAVLQQFDTVLQDTLNIYGTSLSDMLPHQDNAVIKFFTSVGRSVGKKFIMGIVDALATNSTLTAATVTALGLAALEWAATLTSTNGGWRPGNFDAATNTFRPWTGTVEANILVGSQDRRRPGFGL